MQPVSTELSCLSTPSRPFFRRGRYYLFGTLINVDTKSVEKVPQKRIEQVDGKWSELRHNARFRLKDCMES